MLAIKTMQVASVTIVLWSNERAQHADEAAKGIKNTMTRERLTGFLTLAALVNHHRSTATFQCPD